MTWSLKNLTHIKRSYAFIYEFIRYCVKINYLSVLSCMFILMLTFFFFSMGEKGVSRLVLGIDRGCDGLGPMPVGAQKNLG